MLWQIAFWSFGVITCAFYSIALMVQSQQFLVFSPLLFIAIANAYLLLVVKNTKLMSLQKQTALLNINKFALTSATLLFIVLSPLCLLASIAFACFGIGAVVRIPEMILTHASFDVSILLALICLYYLYVAVGPVMTAVYLNIKLGQYIPDKVKALSYQSCLAAILFIVCLGIFPYALTHSCIVASADNENLPKTLLLMRAIGDETSLVNSCNGDGSVASFLTEDGWRGDTVSTDSARELYYRVYGRPFNTAKHPNWSSLITFNPQEILSVLFEDAETSYSYYYHYDTDFAGEKVGGITHGVELSSSKISGSVNTDECLAKLDWKMQFSNKTKGEKELRAQILLPPHAVISGCSLMIDGVKHDAVYATRESAHQSYAESAENGNTPLLISTAGAGRILLQSATADDKQPVELSLQVTSPLSLIDANNAALPVPVITERNFVISCEHQMGVDSPGAASQNLSFKNDELLAGKTAFFWKRDGNKKLFYANDPDKAGNDIIEKIDSHTFAKDKPFIAVVDGSAKMSGSIQKIADQLANVKSKKATIVWASDKPIVVIANADTSSLAWITAVARLRDSACVGGQDNGSALAIALEAGGLSDDSNVVWMHGPQPVAFSGDQLLLVLRGLQHKLNLFEYQVIPGPNEVIKSLDQNPSLHQVPALEGVEKDLARLFAVVSGQSPEFAIGRSSVTQVALKAIPGAISSKDGDTLRRLYYADVILTSDKDEDSIHKLGAIAEKLKIVTPVTSAIVPDWKANQNHMAQLEHHSQSQGQSQDLTSNSATTSKDKIASMISNSPIPVKPEPPLPVTLACAILMLSGVLWIKRRKNQSTLTG